MLAEDSEHRLFRATDQFLGQARFDLGIVAARRVCQPQEPIETGQTDGLAKPEQSFAVQVQHLIEETAEVIPVFVGERDPCLGGFLAKILPVAPSAQVFQMAEGRETRVRKDARVRLVRA